MVRLARPTSQRHSDEETEALRRTLLDAIQDLQGAALSIPEIVAGVSLPDGQVITVAHKLGRSPRWVQASIPRGPVAAGYIEEIRDTADRTRYVALRATGYGATITVDLAVL